MPVKFDSWSPRLRRGANINGIEYQSSWLLESEAHREKTINLHIKPSGNMQAFSPALWSWRLHRASNPRKSEAGRPHFFTVSLLQSHFHVSSKCLFEEQYRAEWLCYNTVSETLLETLTTNACGSVFIAQKYVMKKLGSNSSSMSRPRLIWSEELQAQHPRSLIVRLPSNRGLRFWRGM